MPLSIRDGNFTTALSRHHRGDVVKITAGLCMVCTVLFFCARVMIRWPLRKLVGKDDYMATAATISSFAQLVVIILAVNSGLGTRQSTLSPESMVKAAKWTYTGDMLYILTIYLAKLAVALFFLRLASSRAELIGAIATVVAGVVFGIISLIVIGTIQRVGQPWLIPGPSTGQDIFYRWIAVEVMGDVFEVVLLAYPVILVAKLNMRSDNKWKVIMAFVLRTPVIVLSIFRLISMSQTLTSKYFFHAYAATQIYTQVEMCLTVISATIICLRIFLMAARSGIQGVPGVVDPMDSQLAQGSYGQQSLRSKITKGTMASRSLELEFGVNPQYGETITRAARGNSASICGNGSETAIMVRQTVDVYSINEDHDDTGTPRNVSV